MSLLFFQIFISFVSQFACSVVALNRGSFILLIRYKDTLPRDFRGRHVKYSLRFFFCELLNFINIVGQIFYMDRQFLSLSCSLSLFPPFFLSFSYFYFSSIFSSSFFLSFYLFFLQLENFILFYLYIYLFIILLDTNSSKSAIQKSLNSRKAFYIFLLNVCVLPQIHSASGESWDSRNGSG